MSKKKFVNISLGSLAILLTSQFYGCVFPEEGKATNTDDIMFDEEEGEGRGLDTYGSIQVTAHVMKWLQSLQRDDGSWNTSTADTAAVVLFSAANNVLPDQNTESGAMVLKALQYIVSIQRPSGEYSEDVNENCMAICAMMAGFQITGSPIAERSAHRAYLRMMAKTETVNPWIVSCIRHSQVINMCKSSQEHFVSEIVEKLRRNHDISSFLNLYLLGQITTAETIELDKYLGTISFEKELKNGIDWCYTITEVLFRRGGMQWEKWQKDYFTILRRRLVCIKGEDNKSVAYFEPESEPEDSHGRTYFTARVGMFFATGRLGAGSEGNWWAVPEIKKTIMHDD